MVKKFFQITGIVLGILVLGAGLMFGVVTAYYQTRFMPNTTINAHNAYTLTVSDMNSALTDEMESYTLTLQLEDGEVELDGSDFDYHVDYASSLSQILQRQKSYEWIWYFLHATGYEALPDATYDEGKLLAALSDLACFRQNEANERAVVQIENRMNHYTFRDDRKNALNTAKATEDILNAINAGAKVCDLRPDYDPPKATAAQQRELDRWKEIDKVQNAQITYSDDEITLTIDRHEYAAWIAVDANKQPVFDSDGKVVLDENRIQTFLTKLSDTFNTDQKGRTWKKFKGGTVQIPSNEPGYIVDEEAELAAVSKTVINCWKEMRKPIYSQEGTGHGNAEVGDSYVEVDLGHQKLYYFENYQLKLESDIVTGCKRYHYDTPSMITSIYFMQLNRTLRGENYATFVYYWMAFYNHYGLHDATWRSKFGGDIYLTDGSHGCVNMPKENAAKLYEMVHVGTPVVLYE